jgi:hypothetical protein
MPEAPKIRCSRSIAGHAASALLSSRFGWVRSVCLRPVRSLRPRPPFHQFLSSTARLVVVRLCPDRIGHRWAGSGYRRGLEAGFYSEKERTEQKRHWVSPVSAWLGLSWTAREMLSTFGPQFYPSTTLISYLDVDTESPKIMLFVVCLRIKLRFRIIDSIL